jgi:hypothetical protein
MDPEEGQPNVGDGVEEAADELASFRPELQVAAAERDDPQVVRGARGGGEAIGPAAGARDRATRARLAALVADDELAAALRQRPDTAAEHDLPACGLDLLRELRGDGGEVGDAGRRGVERRDAACVGLDLGDPGRVDAPQPGDAVRPRAPLDLLERRELALLGRDDQLAAALDANPVPLAERVQERRAADAEARLQRARRVVDPRVDDAAVVAGLVRGDARLPLEEDEPRLRPPQQQLARDGEPEDAAADDGDVA